MKKLIFKTAFITFGVALIFLIAIFGIVSFSAPVAMMEFTASLGLDGISGDYAYQAYASTAGGEKLSYLVRAFEISVENGNNRTARSRFEELFGEDGSERRTEFEEFCREWKPGEDGDVSVPFQNYSYRGYLCGTAANVYYRLAKTEEAKAKAFEFAFAQTPALDCGNSPVRYLALESALAHDAEFCVDIYERLQSDEYERNEAYGQIEDILKQCKNFDKILNERSENE
ncbi:MAG: hypothetical protein HFE26_06045 [Clostridia bacterium]|nr:hypothetical protein [Clostridia bacterium]